MRALCRDRDVISALLSIRSYALASACRLSSCVFYAFVCLGSHAPYADYTLYFHTFCTVHTLLFECFEADADWLNGIMRLSLAENKYNSEATDGFRLSRI